MAEHDAVLDAQGLTKTFRLRGAQRRGRRGGDQPVRPALVDVSLRLDRGEIVGVVGESGSGKSTLARCLTLLERPDAGIVRFNGRDLTTLRGGDLRRERRRIQIVFQDPYASLNPRLSVESALAEVLKVHDLVPAAERGHRIRELLDLVGLPTNALSRYPGDFSGGQRQRICIARALAAEPDVLIADEAVSALDVSIQAQILNLLQRLGDQLGLAILFISHDLHVVRRVAGRVVVMFGGRIVESLPPGVPLDQAAHPYTQALLAAAPRLDAAPVADGETESADQANAVLSLQGCPFRERCPYAMQVCADVDPAYTVLAPGHLVACHHVAAEVAEG